VRLLLIACVLVLAVAGEAVAKPRYTKAVSLKQDCPISENYPKAGVPARTWVKTVASGRVGVRYNVNARYALVEDYARGTALPQVNPHWGFVERGCLTAQLRKRSLFGTGGNGRDKRVNFSPTPARTIGVRTAVGSATLRSGAKSFVVGNLGAGDAFRISRRCSSHSSSSFIFGYAAAARRFGWVQSSRLHGDPCVRHSTRVTLRGLRITGSQSGPYEIDQHNHLTVCGPTGSVLLRFDERKYFGVGPVPHRAHTFRRPHAGGCTRYVFSWRVSEGMAGVGTYRMSYRARIGSHRSRLHHYSQTVID
jgi:hypothetical protein